MFFCEDHQRAHLKDRHTKSHKVVPVSKVEFQDVKPSFPTHCAKHQERLKFYCATCSKLICRDCTVNDHEKPDHKVLFILEAAQQRAEVKKLMEAIRPEAAKLKEAIAAVDVMAKKAEDKAAQLIAQAKEVYFSKIHQLLDEGMEALFEDLRSNGETLREQQRRLEATLLTVNRDCERADKALTKGLDEDVLNVKQSLVVLQEEMKKMTCQPQSDANIQLTICKDFNANTHCDISEGKEAIPSSVNSMLSMCFSRKLPSSVAYAKILAEKEEKELKETGGLSSVLLNKQQIDILRAWHGDPKQVWRLLYRGTRDGFEAARFHGNCDNKGPTLVIIKSTSGHLFGGYTPIAWTSRNNYAWDNRTFIFTLTNPHGIPPTKYNNNGPSNDNIGHDIHVANNANQNTSSYTNFGFAFGDTTGKGSSTFTGGQNFQVAEVEVFGHLQ